MASTDNNVQTAAYGLACEACARAKCKCIYAPSAEAGRCERCNRLNKICQPTKSKRQLKPDGPRNYRVEKSRPDDVLRLERKLDQLVAHLKGPQHNLASPSNSDASGLVPSTSWSNEIPSLEAEESLSRFKRCNARFFPFLTLPRTAHELQRDRPNLWACITALSSRQRLKQQERLERMQDMLSTRLIGRPEASVDLLLAVLCYICWAYLQGKHPVAIKATIITFSQLAIALVFDLGLNKTIGQDPPQISCIPPVHMRLPQRPPRTMEECRAVLGTFVLISTFSTAMKRSDPMRWTSHMRDCLAQIEAQQECPLDETLVQCVRIQLIADKAIKAASYDANVNPDDTLQPPPCLFAQEMLTQLKMMKSTMADPIARDVTVLLQFHSAEISINEMALYGDPTATSQHPNMHRTRHLYACTKAIREWCTVFLAIPIVDINGITTHHLMQMRHLLGLLYVLSNIDEPGWRKEDVFAIADIFTLLGSLADKFSQVPAAVNFQGDIDTVDYEDYWWTHVASTLRTLKGLWAGQDGCGDVAAGASSAAPMGEAISLEGIDFDLPGLDWLMDPVMMNYTV